MPKVKSNNNYRISLSLSKEIIDKIDGVAAVQKSDRTNVIRDLLASSFDNDNNNVVNRNFIKSLEATERNTSYNYNAVRLVSEMLSDSVKKSNISFELLKRILEKQDIDIDVQKTFDSAISDCSDIFDTVVADVDNKTDKLSIKIKDIPVEDNDE